MNKSYCDIHEGVDVPLGSICPLCHMAMHCELSESKDKVSALQMALTDAIGCFGESDAYVSKERKEAWEHALSKSKDVTS